MLLKIKNIDQPAARVAQKRVPVLIEKEFSGTGSSDDSLLCYAVLLLQL